jgi:opacity protein-like surface antigen
MKLSSDLRFVVASALVATLACPPAHALVSFNGGHDHIYLTGTIGVAHDSNIFANNLSGGDTIYSASLLAEYARRAGWIAVNGSLEVSTSSFSQHREEDFTNPKLALEFMKQSGRTTGSLLLNASRENRADPEVNFRNEFWSYGAMLNVKYPVIDRYYLTGSLGYAEVDYLNNPVFVDQTTYSASADLFYELTQDRDLLVGYRYRDNESSVNTETADHAFTAGVSGRIVHGYEGKVRVGYQYRNPLHSPERSFSAWTGSASVTHAFGKKSSATLTGSKDFSTTATNINLDSTTLSADYQYAFNARWTAHAGAGYGRSRFLGAAGIDATSGRSREDTMLNADAGVGYSANEHFKLSVNYTWAENWSTLQYSDFIRTGWSLSVVSRW